jgi:hypothetical protein
MKMRKLLYLPALLIILASFVSGVLPWGQPATVYASPGYYDVVSALSPTFWWKLDGDMTDSADSLDGSSSDSPDWVSSIIPAISGTNQCGDFNGSNDVVQIPDSSVINTSTTYQKSISVWIQADTIDTSGNGRIIWNEGGTYNWAALYVWDDSGTDKVYWCVGEGSGNYIDYVSATISTGTVYHIGAVLDANSESMYLYINGSLVDSKTGGLNIDDELAAHSQNNGIGGPNNNVRNHNKDTLSGYFEGEIADFAYWAEVSVLDGSDFESIYTEGIGAVEPDISNTPNSYGFGTVAEGTTKETGLDHFEVTNNSAYAVNITISGTDMAGGTTWVLSDTATPGTNVYGLKAGRSGESYNIVVKKTSPNYLVQNLTGSGGTQQWGLQLLAPTTMSDGTSKSGTVTLTATAA